MTRSIVMERVFDYPPERVWRALTDPADLADWLMDNDFQPVLGHAFTFRTKPGPGFDGIVRCRVTELESPRRLAYTWGNGARRNGRHLDPRAGCRRNSASHGTFRLRGRSRVFPSTVPLRRMEANRSRSSCRQSGRPFCSLPYRKRLRLALKKGFARIKSIYSQGELDEQSHHASDSRCW